MKSTLSHLLRRLATWIDGGESDLDLRARMLNMMRRRPMSGTVIGIECAIREQLPAAVEVVFEWSPDRRTMTMRLL